MCCLNGSRKSHCVRKIIARPYSDIFGAGGYFLRICAIFCRYWTCSFSGRNNQAIGPRLSAIFTFFFSLQSYEKDFWHCHLLSLFVTFCHLSANCYFTMQSYEKGFWHCPHLSAYVRKCPLLSAFLFRCKVTKSKFGTVQICPIMSKFVYLCPFMKYYGIGAGVEDMNKFYRIIRTICFMNKN